MKKQDSMMGIRLPTKDRQQIEQLVKSGQYRTLSDLIRDALTRLLKENA